jgi:hypothetical protein
VQYGPIKCTLHVYRDYSNKYTAAQREREAVQVLPDVLGDGFRVVLDFFEEDGVRQMLSDRGLFTSLRRHNN